jgi:hypothetical protein
LSLARRRHDAHTGGGAAAREGQQRGFWRGDDTTHRLVAEQRRGRVSSIDFGEVMTRRTDWWQNSGVGGSEAQILAG